MLTGYSNGKGKMLPGTTSSSDGVNDQTITSNGVEHDAFVWTPTLVVWSIFLFILAGFAEVVGKSQLGYHCRSYVMCAHNFDREHLLAVCRKC